MIDKEAITGMMIILYSWAKLKEADAAGHFAERRHSQANWVYIGIWQGYAH